MTTDGVPHCMQVAELVAGYEEARRQGDSAFMREHDWQIEALEA